MKLINKKQIFFSFLLILAGLGCKKDDLTTAIPSHEAGNKVPSERIVPNATYTPGEVEQKVKELIAVRLVVDYAIVQNGASLTDDLGADPLDMLRVTSDINEYFNINISVADVELLHTVGQWIARVKFLVGAVSVSQSVRTNVNRVISERFWCELSAISDNVSLRDGTLGGDGLTFTELIMDIEDEFLFDIPDEDWPLITTVASLYSYVAFRTQ